MLLNLSEDHLKRHRYLPALTSCYEGFVHFQTQVTGIYKDRENNEELRKKFEIIVRDHSQQIWRQLWTICIDEKTPSLRKLRNQVVHSLSDEEKTHVQGIDLKKQIKLKVKETIKIIRKLNAKGLK